MNVSNTISYDPTYSKNELSEYSIKQGIPKIRENNDFKDNLDKLDGKQKNDDITQAINKSNKTLQVFDRKLEISVHEKTQEIMVKVIDTNTDEIIREIPPEKVLDKVANVKEMLGFLLDKRI